MNEIPELMGRIWDGDPNEFFTYADMNRVEANANIVARYAGILEMGYMGVTRASQFRYDEAQKLEDHISTIAGQLGISVDMEKNWNYNRSVSYVDFERWESELWKLYKALGGRGDRIPSDKTLHTVHATLFSGAWKGAGPYYQDLETPLIREGMEAIVYVAENATASQRISEYNAVLQATGLMDGITRVYAHNIKPRENIPIKITTKAFKMFKSIVLKANAWQGSGPWTQAVDMGGQVANAVIGSDNRNNTAQMEAITRAVIGVSGLNGNLVTIRAVSEKPTQDVNMSIMWSAESVS